MKASYVVPVYNSGTHSHAGDWGGGSGCNSCPSLQGERHHGAHAGMGVSTGPEPDRARQTPTLSFLCNPGWSQACYISKEDLGLLILLPPSPKVWDYRRVPSHLVYVLLGIQLRVSCTLGRHKQLSDTHRSTPPFSADQLCT